MYNESIRNVERINELYKESVKSTERMIELYKQSITISEKMIELYKETAKNTEKVTYLYKESVKSTERMIRYWQDLFQNPWWPPTKEGVQKEKEKEKEEQIDNNYTASRHGEILFNSEYTTIPQEVTKLKKLPNVAARYMKMQQFKDSVTIQNVSAITAKYIF